MSQALFDKIESEQYRAEPLEFNVGDIVKVHTRVKEGGKERTQVFQGIVIALSKFVSCQEKLSILIEIR